MRLPPKWVRRIFLAPLIPIGVVLLVLVAPIGIIAAVFIFRYVPYLRRPLRILWFIFLYLVIEAVALIVMFFLWIGSGFGWKIGSPRFQEIHYELLGWMLRRVVHSATFAFKVGFAQDGPRPATVGSERRRPAMVLSRHAGPGDSILLMNALVNDFHRRPRIVLKEFLQWDPAVDVMLNRLPVAFVPVGRKGGEVLLDAIRDLARTLGPDDAFVIFPEGGNFSERRRLRAIAKLIEMGRVDLAERAEALERTLPPRSTGVKTALAVAPPDTEVFLVGHAGLEALDTASDIWRAMPFGTTVLVRTWHVPAEKIPGPDDQEAWLFDLWTEIDDWIQSNLSERGEWLFDDPDAY